MSQQQPNAIDGAQQVFNLSLTAQQISLIGDLLGQAPYRVVAPLVASINQQIALQTAAGDRHTDEATPSA